MLLLWLKALHGDPKKKNAFIKILKFFIAVHIISELLVIKKLDLDPGYGFSDLLRHCYYYRWWQRYCILQDAGSNTLPAVLPAVDKSVDLAAMAV